MMATRSQRREAGGPLDAGRPRDAGQARDGQGGCVPIVEDDAVEGLHVLEAEDGLEGLEQARCERPDLVLTDVKMPGLDGFQLAERLRRDERTRRIPLIFLSGEAGQENAERARTLGTVAYLTKPFDPRTLAAFVAHEPVAARAGSSDLTATVAI
jgi:CheY-like chemotaxis protein